MLAPPPVAVRRKLRIFGDHAKDVKLFLKRRSPVLALHQALHREARSKIKQLRGEIEQDQTNHLRSQIEMKISYYRADGLKDVGAEPKEVPAFYEITSGQWQLTSYDFTSKTDSVCIPVHEAIKRALFTAKEFERAAPFVQNSFIYEAGIDPESTCSKVDFEKALANVGEDNDLLNKALYWQDFCFLLSNIQTVQMEIISTAGEFYRLLSEYEFSGLPKEMRTSVRRSDTPETRMATLLLCMIFIRMHSILDFLVKLAREAERPMPTFLKYPRLKGANDQFGDRKRLKMNKLSGSLFEECNLVRTIESVRNRVIHNGHLSPNQWIYERYCKGETAERFILFPDMVATAGIFDKSGSRTSFYSRENKINLQLPGIIAEFFDRCTCTLQGIETILEARKRW